MAGRVLVVGGEAWEAYPQAVRGTIMLAVGRLEDGDALRWPHISEEMWAFISDRFDAVYRVLDERCYLLARDDGRLVLTPYEPPQSRTLREVANGIREMATPQPVGLYSYINDLSGRGFEDVDHHRV